MTLMRGSRSELILGFIIDWLDSQSLQLLDTAIVDGISQPQSNFRLSWQKCLTAAVENNLFEEARCCHSWIQWLVKRKIGQSRIQFVEWRKKDITNQTFRYISMPSLTFIDLSDCTSITNAGISIIAEGCIQLETILLGGCLGLTDAALVSIGQHCHYLRVLDLCSCSFITDDGLADLVQGCPLFEIVLWLLLD
jgi:Leucine Rich repeat